MAKGKIQEGGVYLDGVHASILCRYPAFTIFERRCNG